MKLKLCVILLLAFTLLLTACPTLGTSSATSPASEAGSSKAAVSSKADTSSRATSSSKYAPTVHYMNYEEYFSRDRAINKSGWNQYDSELESMFGRYFQKDGVLFSTCPAEHGTFAETETGLLLLAGGRVYEATEPNKPARLVYEPKLP